MGHENCSVSETKRNAMFSQIPCQNFELLIFPFLCPFSYLLKMRTVKSVQLNMRQVHKDRAPWVSCFWWQCCSPGNAGNGMSSPWTRYWSRAAHRSVTSSLLSHSTHCGHDEGASHSLRVDSKHSRSPHTAQLLHSGYDPRATVISNSFLVLSFTVRIAKIKHICLLKMQSLCVRIKTKVSGAVILIPQGKTFLPQCNAFSRTLLRSSG